MDREFIIRLLSNALSPDEQVRTEAERTIKSLLLNDFMDLLMHLVKIATDTELPFSTRHIGSIIAKNSLYSKNQRIQKGYESNWAKCPPQFKFEIVKLLQQSIGMREKAILSNLTKILGSIIRMELLKNEQRMDYDFFGQLLDMVSYKDFAIGVLETISHACNQLLDETCYSFSNERGDKIKIYQIGTYYLGNPESTQEITLAALKCILSSLEVYEDVFVSDSKRGEFFYKILNFDANNFDVVGVSLEIVNRSIDIFNNIPDSEICRIWDFYKSFFSQPENVPIQVFEFWTLLIELEKSECLSKCLPSLVASLLSCLKKEDADDNDWTSHKAARNLFLLLNKTLHKSLISDVMCQNFILDKLQSSDTKDHAIAHTALACVAGPGAEDFVYARLPSLIADLDYTDSAIEALYALEKVCEVDIYSTVDFLPSILEKCGSIIQTSSEFDIQATWVFHSILTSMKSGVVEQVEKTIVFHYTNIMSILINKLNASKPESYELRNALNTTLSELISSCPHSHSYLLDHFESYLYSRINQFIENIKVSAQNDVFVLDDLICGSVILLESTLSMKKIFDVNTLCKTFVDCLLLPEMLVRGEVYIAMSKLLCHFSIHLKKFMPYILRDLASNEIFVMKSAINLLSECALFLESVFCEYTYAVVPALITAISSPAVPLELKPEIINVLGTVALAIGKSFAPFLEMCVILFSQINTLDRLGDEDYVDSLRKSVMKLFSCILVAVRNSNEIKAIFPKIFDNIKISIEADVDSAYTKESLDLICDIQNLLGTRYLDVSWIREYLEDVMRSQKGTILSKARNIYDLSY